MKITVTLDHSKETPGTHRFDNKDDEAFIQSVYVKKGAFGSEPPPKQITLTVESK